MKLIDAQKIYQNKILRLQTLYKIKDKNGNSTNLKLNRIQQLIVNDVKDMDVIRHITIKYRQGGVSTFWLLWWLDETLFRKNVNTGILAHKREALDYLWNIIYYAYENLPPLIKPKLKRDSAKELYFEGSDSRIFVSLGIRSTALHNLHISEWCFCKDDDIRATLGAVSPNTNISGESTGHGIGNDGYLTYMDAKEGKNGYNARFIPWYLQEEYQLPLNGMTPDILERTASQEERIEESKLKEIAKQDYNIDITPEQILFRRQTKHTQKSLYFQEYPEREEDAFTTSGDRFFNNRKITALIKELREYRKTHEFYKIENDYIYFEKPDKHDIYCAGADTSLGINDYNVLKIINVTKRREAFVYRAKCGINKFYGIIDYHCRQFRNPLLAVEANNTGHAVILGLKEICNYPNLWHEVPKNRLKAIGFEDKSKIVWGWNTTSRTRPLLLSNLRQSIEDDEDIDENHFQPEFMIYDDILLSEALTFIKKDDKFEAEEGKNDDDIFATGLAYQMFKLLVHKSRTANNIGGNIGFNAREPSESFKEFG